MVCEICGNCDVKEICIMNGDSIYLCKKCGNTGLKGNFFLETPNTKEKQIDTGENEKDNNIIDLMFYFYIGLMFLIIIVYFTFIFVLS
jgi:ribosome-binding protein aMBF1 (putative translation factor)